MLWPRRTWMIGRPLILVGMFSCLLLFACADGGRRISEPKSPVPPSDGPIVTRLFPARTIVADTVRVEGSGFGTEAAGAVSFAGATGSIPAEALAWSETAITVLVPDQAADGPVIVRAGDLQSEGENFSVAQTPISYATHLIPLFTAKSCIECHSGPGGENGLRLESAALLLRGESRHGPVVLPRDGAGSILAQKLSPSPPFGNRMPSLCTGNCLTDDQILEITDWIDQGARNN